MNECKSNYKKIHTGRTNATREIGKLRKSEMKLMRLLKRGKRFKGEKAAYEIIYSMCCKQGWLVIYKVRRLVMWRNILVIGDLRYFFLS